MIHYTLNTADSVDSPRSRVADHVLQILRPLAKHGGAIPNYAPFRVQVTHGQNGDREADTEQSVEMPEQEAETIHSASLAQIYQRRWLSYQSLKNKNHSDRSQESNSSLQDVEGVPTQPVSSSPKMAMAAPDPA